MSADQPTKLNKSQLRAQIQAYTVYYQSKIACLTNKRLPAPLLLLACKDAPFQVEDLTSQWQRGRYIKKCLKYYQKKLKELEKEHKKIQ
ncbi:MAG: hypothetical protein H8E41_08680 [Desulfobulbaceae bacterium]|uniref:Uncharacterized protein n=1 Tax=Candidatus Desulfobia pelagia TaxID=2841692 RepID=A0A8J6NDH2_9BACT|nr:hypothetical protein [Candidatus Desulfobia pelagia]